jgi:competence protein ComEC
VGSLTGRVEVRAPPIAADFALRVAAAIDGARNDLTRRIAGAIGGQAGAVAAALVTGKRGLIGEDTNDALRAAGIYHIVSISGLHMVLAAGTMFWLARALLAAIPVLALQWPVKKIAAVTAMLGAVAYCVFSGSEVATERALVMTLVMLGAILVDRPALSMRNLALSALIVLAREPEALPARAFRCPTRPSPP